MKNEKLPTEKEKQPEEEMHEFDRQTGNIYNIYIFYNFYTIYLYLIVGSYWNYMKIKTW